MGSIVSTGFPLRPFERATHKRYGAVAACFLAATSTSGWNEEGAVLATSAVVVEVHRMLNQGTGQPRFGEHDAQPCLSDRQFADGNPPVFSVGTDDIAR